MLEDYKFLSESFVEKRTDYYVVAIVAFKNEEKSLLKEKITEWFSQSPNIIETAEELFSLLNHNTSNFLLIINEEIEDREFSRAIRVSGKRPVVLTLNLKNESIDSLKVSLNEIFQTKDFGLGLTCNSPPMKDLLKNLKRMAKGNDPVLIMGPIGSGKKTIAKLLHKLSNVPGDLIQVNNFSINQNAVQGNYFLPNIEGIPADYLNEQVKNQKDSKRFFFTTNLDLPTFMEVHPELYERFRENILIIPSLTQRKEDIPIIVQQFIGKYSSIHNSEGTSIDESALRILVDYEWPNNVLELENLIQRLVILHGGQKISPLDLPEKLLKKFEKNLNFPLPPMGLILREVIQGIENSLIDQALSRSLGNKNQAAKLLGLNRTTLVEKLRKRSTKS